LSLSDDCCDGRDRHEFGFVEVADIVARGGDGRCFRRPMAGDGATGASEPSTRRRSGITRDGTNPNAAAVMDAGRAQRG
jgi:hypothetical protein